MTDNEEKQENAVEDESLISQDLIDNTMHYIQCKVAGCNRRYTQKKNMLAHVRSVHDKFSKKFYCPIENCGQYFNYKHVLDRHMKNNTHKEISEDPDEEPDYDEKQWKRLFGSLICFATNEKKSDSPERFKEKEKKEDNEEEEEKEERNQPRKRVKN